MKNHPYFAIMCFLLDTPFNASVNMYQGYIFLFAFLVITFVWGVCVHAVCLCFPVCHGERVRGQLAGVLSHSAVWVSGIRVMSLGLAASVLAC